MASLTDQIEDYLKKMLDISPRDYIEIQRADLARKFSCVPSQVSYVLSSRFSPARGYLVESKRGGNGYIRLYRIARPQGQSWTELWDEIGAAPFEPARAKQFTKRIFEEKVLTRREMQILNTLLQDKHYRGLGRDEIRGLQKELFQASLEAILKDSC